MGIKVTKEQGVMVSLTTVVTVLVAIGTAYPTAKAVLADEIKDQIQQEIKPLTMAFEVTLEQNVRTLRSSIVALEFKRDMCGTIPDCWTVRDAQDLTNLRDDLEAAVKALTGIKNRVD